MSEKTTNKKTEPRRRYTLRTEERLHKKKAIQQLFSTGKTIKTPAIILLYYMEARTGDVPAQVLFSVSKRNFKRAHDRNRIKRLMREAYRKQKHILYTSLEKQQKQLAIAFIFTGRQLPEYRYIHNKIFELIQRFLKENYQNKAPLPHEKK